MADLVEDEICQTEEELIQRQKREKKALQVQTTKLKHSISKGDKKKMKEIKEKIASLEAEMKEKHEKELANFTPTTSTVDKDTAVCEKLDELNLDKNEGDDPADEEINHGNKQEFKQKKSKAQKRREKKAAEAQAREDRISEQEIENLTSSRHLEAVNIKALLAKRGLQIFEIPSDGDCLYAAVNHQLKQRDIPSTTTSLRKQVADFMRKNLDSFLPFLTKDNGDCFTMEDFEEYCVQLESSPAWGGQLEIQALSSILKVPIEVIQAEGPPLVTGEEFSQPSLILTYYRHAYGLGEHYHSVQTLTHEDEDEFT